MLASVRVADGWELPLARRTGRVKMPVMTSCAPVAIDLVFRVVPGDGGELSVSSKSMRECPWMDIMCSLSDTAMKR